MVSNYVNYWRLLVTLDWIANCVKGSLEIASGDKFTTNRHIEQLPCFALCFQIRLFEEFESLFPYPALHPFCFARKLHLAIAVTCQGFRLPQPHCWLGLIIHHHRNHSQSNFLNLHQIKPVRQSHHKRNQCVSTAVSHKQFPFSVCWKKTTLLFCAAGKSLKLEVIKVSWQLVATGRYYK